MEKDTHELVKKAYGEVARSESSCCGPQAGCCGEQAVAEPEADLGLSCGDPISFTQLKEGEVVLDLGSGAGKDVFEAARRVGPKGRVIGVDMTPEMVERARRNAEAFRARTGLDNVEFREGLIEELPLADGSVDAVISNCVINLSPDKPRVFREARRVLKPGGRAVVSDIVLTAPLPDWMKNDSGFYVACVAGALMREEYLAAIRDAGFESVEVVHDRSRTVEDASKDPLVAKFAHAFAKYATSITVVARK